MFTKIECNFCFILSFLYLQIKPFKSAIRNKPYVQPAHSSAEGKSPFYIQTPAGLSSDNRRVLC